MLVLAMIRCGIIRMYMESANLGKHTFIQLRVRLAYDYIGLFFNLYLNHYVRDLGT